MVSNNENRPTLQGDVIYHNKNMCRKKKGHPNNTHIRIEMDTADKLQRKFGLCHLIGHTRKYYHNV